MRRELATIGGTPPPSDLPRGECTVTRLPGDRIRIDQADPRVLISAEVPGAIVDKPTPDAWLDLAGCTTYDGGLLKIHAVNRTVIYRIVSYVSRVRGYIGEWPD